MESTHNLRSMYYPYAFKYIYIYLFFSFSAKENFDRGRSMGISVGWVVVKTVRMSLIASVARTVREGARGRPDLGGKFLSR